MPQYRIPGANLDLPRNLASLDTNVLVALANPDDQRHEDTCAVLEVEEFRWLVIPSVLVEVWGLLVGSRGMRDRALALFAWLLTPGNVILLPDSRRPLEEHVDSAATHRIDIVDAELVRLADYITRSCNLVPDVFIVTFDTGDFLRCKSDGYRFSIYDMNTFEQLPFR